MTGKSRGPANGRRFGQYRLLELIGRGGMGEVWRAYDERRDRVVALKLLLERLTDEVFAARFRAESQLVARLRDPHVIPIHDYGEIDGRLFLDMRFIEGADLAAVLQRDGPMSPERAVDIVGQVAGALATAHDDGLLHRDVKPSNILLTGGDGSGRPDFAYLVDFGIAVATEATGLTRTGQAVGTAAYMSPERLQGHRGDHRGDVYALGCVLYECLTGQKPYPTSDMLAQVFAHVNQPVPRPSEVRPGLPPGFDAVISRSMAKHPGSRTASATELAAEASAALRQPGPTAPATRLFLGAGTRSSSDGPAPAGARRRRRTAWVAAAVAAVAGAAILVPALTPGNGGTQDAERSSEPAAGGSSAPTAPQFPAGTTMARLAEAGTMRIATRYTLPLYSLAGIGGDPEGFEVEIAKVIAGGLGIPEDRIEWVETGLTEREAALEEGRVDMVVATYTITDARRERVSFAGPYLNGGQTLMVRRDNTRITGPETLRGNGPVCSVTGSTPAANIAPYVEPSQLVLFERYSTCADALRAGQVDAVTTEGIILAGLAAASGGAFTVLGEPFTVEPYGVGITRGDVQFCEFINTSLAEASASGVYEQAWALTAGVVSPEIPTLPEPVACR